MGNQTRLVKRIEALERKVEAINQAAGSALVVEALVELAGGDAVVQAKAAELEAKKRAAAEGQAAETIAAAVKEGKLAPVEAVTERCFVVAKGAEGHRADVALRMLPPQVRAGWIGKKAGDVVDGFTIAEVYELQRPKPRTPPAAVETAAAALEGGKEVAR